MGSLLALRKRLLPPKASHVPKEPSSFPQIDSEAEFKRRLLQHKARLIVVDFYAPWCSPCKKMHSQLKALARKYPRVVFFMVNVDTAPDIADQFDVMTIPTFLFFREQEVVDAYSGSIVDEVEARVAVLSRSDYKLHLNSMKEDNVDIANFYKDNFLEMLFDVEEDEAVAGGPGQPDVKDTAPIATSSKDAGKPVATSALKPGTSEANKTPVKKVRISRRSTGNTFKTPVTHSGNSVKPSTRHSVKPSSRVRGNPPPTNTHPQPPTGTPGFGGPSTSTGVTASGNTGISAFRKPPLIATGRFEISDPRNEIRDWFELREWRKWYQFGTLENEAEKERKRKEKHEQKEKERQHKKEMKENARIEKVTREKRARQEKNKREKEERERKAKEQQRKEKEQQRKEQERSERKEKEKREKEEREKKL